MQLVKVWKFKKDFFLLAGLIISFGLMLMGLASCYVQSNREIQPLFAFASDRSGAGDIYIVDDENQLLNLTDHPAADWDPAWSPDGDRLIFTSHRSGNSDIWLLEIPAMDHPPQLHNLTNDPAWDYSPTWSPRGQSVAFVSERDEDPEIFVQNMEEEVAIQLTFNEEMDRLPAWSPDGKLIAFAAVRDGIERIHLIRPDGTDEQQLTPDLQGTSPTWAPDSQRLAFVGWDDENQLGIYILDLESETESKAKAIELVYQGNGWLGSLDWSADGQWLTFTSWATGNHEVYALPLETDKIPFRLSSHKAWDDFLVLHPQKSLPEPLNLEAMTYSDLTLESGKSTHVRAGVNIADLSLTYLVKDMGFKWAKSFVNWATVEPEPGQYRWIDPDNIVEAFGDQEVKILMRIHGTPSWARPPDTSFTHPPDDLAAFSNFITAVATRYKGQVEAYEIWNEPNLYYEWGNLEPDPVLYTQMLKTAYIAIKKVDPEALVISGGLSTTGEGSPTAYGDLDFIQGMYDAGAKDYFDALGSHPYAYGHSPDDTHPNGLSLDRVVEQYQVMQANGDGETPIWITELGWVLKTHWNLGEHASIGVTQQQQADYLRRTYGKIETEWPFVEAVFLFNLDFSTVSWYPAAEPMRWYAILNPDRTPRPAYTILRQKMSYP